MKIAAAAREVPWTGEERPSYNAGYGLHVVVGA